MAAPSATWKELRAFALTLPATVEIVIEWIAESYRLVAPKKLVARMQERTPK